MTKEDNLLRYRISFKTEKIDDFFRKLRDVLDRIVDAGIKYTIDSVNTYEVLGTTLLTGNISGRTKFQKHPYCIGTSKIEIEHESSTRNHIDKYCLYISF